MIILCADASGTGHAAGRRFVSGHLAVAFGGFGGSGTNGRVVPVVAAFTDGGGTLLE
jgi:hypothetical protein